MPSESPAPGWVGHKKSFSFSLPDPFCAIPTSILALPSLGNVGKMYLSNWERLGLAQKQNHGPPVEQGPAAHWNLMEVGIIGADAGSKVDVVGDLWNHLLMASALMSWKDHQFKESAEKEEMGAWGERRRRTSKAVWERMGLGTSGWLMGIFQGPKCLLYARACARSWEADSPSPAGVPQSTVEYCFSDPQAEYDLLSGPVIYQERKFEDGGENTKRDRICSTWTRESWWEKESQKRWLM